jgi:hypothetical protein
MVLSEGTAQGKRVAVSSIRRTDNGTRDGERGEVGLGLGQGICYVRNRFSPSRMVCSVGAYLALFERPCSLTDNHCDLRSRFGRSLEKIHCFLLSH